MNFRLHICHTVLAFLTIIVLSGCISTTRNITGLHGAFYSLDSYTGNRIVNSGLASEFENHLKTAIPDPANTNLVIFLHGTDGSGVGQKCRPVKYAPMLIKELISDVPNTVSYYHCANVISGGNSGKSIQLSDAVLRSHEIAELIERFHSYGIHYKRIFLIGNSGGASTTLFLALNYPKKFNGFIASAPGYGFAYIVGDEANLHLKKRYNQWKSTLSNIKNANGIIYAYNDDKYSPPKQMMFLNKIDGIKIFFISASLCNGWDPHAYLFTKCFSNHHKVSVASFMRQKIADAGIDNTKIINSVEITTDLNKQTNKKICAKAIQWKKNQIVWETTQPSSVMVSEARRRSLTPDICMDILGWESSS